MKIIQKNIPICHGPASGLWDFAKVEDFQVLLPSSIGLAPARAFPVSVCVCESPSVESYIRAGGNGPFMSPSPTKLLMNWEDITTDHRDVPASVPSDS